MTKYVIINGELYHYNMNTQNELKHYGIPRRSGRYKWGSGKNPYQGDDIEKIFEEKIKNLDLKEIKDNSGDLVIKTNIGNIKDVNVRLQVADFEGNIKDLQGYAKKAGDFIKAYNDAEVKEAIAKDYFDDYQPWVNDGADSSKAISRDDFMKNMKLLSMSINPDWNLFNVMYSDGGAYYGHAFDVYGSLIDRKVRDISLFG